MARTQSFANGSSTCSNPGGTDYAHLITTGTPGFSDLPTALTWRECKVECAFITLPKLFGSFSNFDLAELAAEKIPREEINQIVHG